MTFHPLSRARRTVERVRKRFAPTGVILMYHRVAPHAIDPWELNVTPEHFDAQMRLLTKHTQPMSLVELAQAHRSGKLPDRFSVVTFDDGYANNLHHARPVLEKHRVPATVFITTGYIGKDREYWWEELDDLLLSPPTLPDRLELTLGGKAHAWDLGDAAKPYNDPTHTKPDPIRDARLAFYMDVWEPMQQVPHQQIFDTLDRLREWAGWSGKPRDTHRAMTRAELLELIDDSVVQVGGHTITHSYLPGMTVEQQREEVVGGKAELEAMVGRPVTTFSYPFNSHTAQTEQIVRESGYAIACSGYEQSAWKHSDRVRMPRFGVEDLDADTFERSLLRWLS